MADTEAGKGTMQQVLETLVAEIDASVARARAALAPLQTAESLTADQARALTAAHIVAVQTLRAADPGDGEDARRPRRRPRGGLPVTEEETRAACGCPSCKAPRPNVGPAGMIH